LSLQEGRFLPNEAAATPKSEIAADSQAATWINYQ